MLRMNFLVVLLYWVSSFHGCTNTETMLLHTVGEVTHVVMSTLRVCFGEHRLERDNPRIHRCCYARFPLRWMNKTRSRKGREKLPLMLWVWLLLACLHPLPWAGWSLSCLQPSSLPFHVSTVLRHWVNACIGGWGKTCAHQNQQRRDHFLIIFNIYLMSCGLLHSVRGWH